MLGFQCFLCEIQMSTHSMAGPDRDPEQVRAMFGRVARRYRLANTILSAGLDARWRRRAAAIVRGWNPRRILDVATGSGDLARAIELACPGPEVVGADFSPQMLDVARGLGSRHLVQADALAMPFAESEFDVVTVAFGLRNMASWEGALGEMRRVLRPGGRLLVLDFSLPTGPLRSIYRPYLHHVLPRLAGWLTREADAYRYLGASIEAFPSGKALCELIEKTGFESAAAEALSGGIVSIYTAQNPPTNP
jgi:demethylmenaquinone methyltransferase/2-methoxy-6-polyprenyl-1,4-benzoquinol methylase